MTEFHFNQSIQNIFSFTNEKVTSCIIKQKKYNWQLTAKGSACSHDIRAPHEGGLIFSGRDSGTASSMKQISTTATTVATNTTKLSPYKLDRCAPIAGLVTKLAANVADT